MVSTIIPIPLSPAEIARNITTKMEFVRESLFSKGEYLADSDILDRVLWEPVGSGHQLMIKPDHPTAPSPVAADLDDPAAETSASSSNEDTNTSPKPVDTPLPTTDVPAESSEMPSMPAILCMVVQLIPGASWLYPDAKWTKNNRFSTLGAGKDSFSKVIEIIF